MRFFVTGATGFIGGRLARRLIDSSHEVVTIARTPSKATHLTEIGVEVHPGDITDKDSLRAPMRDVDGVFHLAAWYKVGARDKRPAQAINVDGTRNVLELMRDLAINKGVYTSTLAVNSDTHGELVDEHYVYNGPHLSEYDRTKWEAHYHVAEPMIDKGLPLVMVMPGLVYGVGDTSPLHQTLVQYLQQTLPLVPLKTAFTWAHVDDVVRGHILAMERGVPGETYIIAGPPHTLLEALEIAERITGIPVPKRKVSPGMMKLMAGVMGVVERVMPVSEMFASETLRVNAGVTYIGSNEKAKQELGYNPRSLEQGFRHLLPIEMERLGIGGAERGKDSQRRRT